MRIMAVDWGESRTGIAVCDPGEILASPVCVINEKNTLRAIKKIKEQAAQLGAELVVVGNPINMDGSRGERSEKCAFVRKKLEGAGLKVRLWDERSSTKTAMDMLTDSGTFGKKRKETLDAVAAVVILESFLSYRKNAGLQS